MPHAWLFFILIATTPARGDVAIDGLKWSVGGRSLAAVSAVAFPMSDGNALINIHDHPHSGCTIVADKPALPEEPRLTLILVIPWKSGARVDAAALRPPRSVDLSELRIDDRGQLSRRAVWNAVTGSVVTERAPRRAGARGRLRLSLRDGEDALQGVIDVTVCPTST